MYEAGLPEAYFGLGGVHVHIDFGCWHLEEQKHDRKGCGWQDIFVGLSQCVQDEAVAHLAAVDEDVNGPAIEFL